MTMQGMVPHVMLLTSLFVFLASWRLQLSELVRTRERLEKAKREKAEGEKDFLAKMEQVQSTVQEFKQRLTKGETGEYSMEILIFTYNRLPGLERLWTSLLTADYMGHRVDIKVFYDLKEPVEERDQTSVWLQDEAKWPYGKFSIHKRTLKAGLRHSIMEGWYPTGPKTFAAFFEDDLEVSPLWYKWADSAIRTYYLDAKPPHPKLIGVSLYRPVHDELTEKPMPISNGDKPFLLQQPCSWGAIYFPEAWRYFRDWMPREKSNPALYELPLSSNGWSSKSSWKKYLIKLMYKRGLFMVYPNLPNREVLCTNHFMRGEHKTPEKTLYSLPLMTTPTETNGKDSFETPPLASLKVFDVTTKEVTGISDLPNADADFMVRPFR